MGMYVDSQAQTSRLQYWGDVILGYNLSNTFYVEADWRTRSNLSNGDDRWTSNGLALKLDYRSLKFLRISYELINSYTNQISGFNSYDLAQRLGFRAYVFRYGNNLFKPGLLEEGINKRLELSNLLRMEHRFFWYSGDVPSTNNWRLRNRTQLKWAISRESFLENKLVAFNGDVEFYIPFDDDALERYVSKLRFRVGPEYKHSSRWRFYVYYIFEDARDNVSKSFKADHHMLNMRIKHTF
jgi:hypothetical protein